MNLALYLIGYAAGIVTGASGVGVVRALRQRKRLGGLPHSAEVVLEEGPWNGRRVLVHRGVSWADTELAVDVSTHPEEDGVYVVDWGQVRSPRARWRQAS